MRENAIEAECVRIAEFEYSVLSRKLVSENKKGAFDRIYVLPNGHLFFCEHKQPRGRPSAHQIREQKRLRKLGHVAEFAYSVPKFRALLAREWLVAMSVAKRVSEDA